MEERKKETMNEIKKNEKLKKRAYASGLENKIKKNLLRQL